MLYWGLIILSLVLIWLIRNRPTDSSFLKGKSDYLANNYDSWMETEND
jgi:uncharacterized membrane protein YukC